MRYDNDAKQMKYEVLTRIAKLSYDGQLDHEHLHNVPFEIIPGRTPKYRCCVYKEREIIRERVQVAIGNNISENDEIISVLPAACEGCPINRFTVTTNCQKCMAKKCVAACPFGAISISGERAYIDQSKCKECGRCANACPYNAIADTLRPCKRSCPTKALTISDDKIAMIEYEKCISCGSCVAACPFGAISDQSSITQIIDEIKGDKKVYAMFAPAIEGQFGKANVGMIKSAIKKLGFDGVYEVALGADAVSEHESHDVEEAILAGRKITTSCCPAFVAMIRKLFPKLVDYISETVTPMAATARYIQTEHPGAVTVFIGPCMAKKNEIRVEEDTADYVMTAEELVAMFDAKNINPEEEVCDNEQDGSVYGKIFARTGGVAEAVLKALEERNCNLEVSVLKCAGADECRKALLMLGAGKLKEDMIEGMACAGGCIAGPASVDTLTNIIKNRQALLKQADERTITDNLKAHEYERVNMVREYTDK